MKKINTLSMYLGFTLVELVIVIMMLGILSTISFVSYVEHTKNSRDSARIESLSDISEMLEIHLTENGFYPTPEGATNIQFSGNTIWSQGIFGEETAEEIGKINHIPKDPSSYNYYSYSITEFGNEYQLGTIQESDEKTFFIPNASAKGGEIPMAIIFGSYNEKILRTNSAGTQTGYILTIPSIIASNTDNSNIDYIMSNELLSYKGYYNLPESYKNSDLNVHGGFGFSTSNYLVYSGILDELKTDETKRLILLENIQKAYSGTIIQNDIGTIMTVSINHGSPSEDARDLGKFIVEKYLGKHVIK